MAMMDSTTVIRSPCSPTTPSDVETSLFTTEDVRSKVDCVHPDSTQQQAEQQRDGDSESDVDTSLNDSNKEENAMVTSTPQTTDPALLPADDATVTADDEDGAVPDLLSRSADIDDDNMSDEEADDESSSSSDEEDDSSSDEGECEESRHIFEQVNVIIDYIYYSSVRNCYFDG